MEKQQTAVEKLFRVFMDNNMTLKLSDFEKALEEEKNQIENAWVASAQYGAGEITESDEPKLAEIYYNNQYC